LEKSLWQKARRADLIILPLFAFLLCMAATVAVAAGGGEPGAYLRPPAGAAATALGGAYTAMPDYYAAWWNPAALGFLREHRIAGGTGLRSMGRLDAFGAFDFPIPPRVGMGLLMLYRGDPSLKLYGTDERLLPTSAYTTMTFKGALSYYVNRKLSVGACISGLYQSLPTYGGDNGIADASATGIGAIDLAALYRISKNGNLALLVKNLGARMDWQMGDFSPLVSDRPLPEFVAAASWMASFQHKPLLWLIDCRGYLVDGEWNKLDRPEAICGTGAEWRRWDNFFLRAGIGSIALNSFIFSDADRYYGEAAFQVTAGFSYDLTRVRKGLWLNYGVATDKVWAGIDQQLDIAYAF
jgi:hypothetical protein